MRIRTQRLAQIAQAGGTSEPVELAVRCKDNTTRTVITRVTLLEGEARLNTLYDITELREARDAAEQAVGMTDLLAKPVTLEALTAILGRWLGAPPATEILIRRPATAQESLEIPGFDQRTLPQTAGSRERVVELLQRFAQAVRDDARTIATALARGAGAEAGRQVHRLKGTAGNLVASDLYAAAAGLEAVLQAGGDPTAALETLARVHAQTLARIADLPAAPAADQAASAAGDPAALPGLLAEIHALLVTGLLVSPHLLAALQAALPAGEQGLYRALKDNLARFDYPSASRLLEPLLSSSPPQVADHE